MPDDGSLSERREVKSSKKPRKEEGDETGGDHETAALIRGRCIIDQQHGNTGLVGSGIQKELGKSEAQVGKCPPVDLPNLKLGKPVSIPSNSAAAVQDTAQALNQLTFKQGSPLQEPSLADPPSPKKRKAASSVKEDSLLLPTSDGHLETGDDQICLQSGQESDAKHSGRNSDDEQPEVVGDLSHYFKQIQLNKDFYEAIARTESRCDEELRDPNGASRSHRDRDSILRAVDAAKELVIDQIQGLLANIDLDSSRFEIALQSYACYALQTFTKHDSESFSYEESVSQTSSVHAGSMPQAWKATLSAATHSLAHESENSQDKENIQQEDVAQQHTTDSSPASSRHLEVGGPVRGLDGPPTTPGAKREKIQSVTDHSSGDPSRLSNDPPKRQRKGPGFLVGSLQREEWLHLDKTPFPLEENLNKSEDHHHDKDPKDGKNAKTTTSVEEKVETKQNKPPARIASRGSFSRQPAAETSPRQPLSLTAEEAWGSALVCADLTINDVASTQWPRNLNDPVVNWCIENETLKQFTAILEGKIIDSYDSTRHREGRVGLSSVKCLVAATAFDELLREHKHSVHSVHSGVSEV